MVSARVHAHRHDARRRRLARRAPPTTARTPSSPPGPRSRSTRTTGRPSGRPSTPACSSRSAPSRGVAVAVGDITDEAKIIERDGKPVGDGPYFGVGFDAAGAGRRAADAVPPRQRPLGHRPGRGRDRRRHRRGPGLRGRRHACRSRPAARRTTSGRRHRRASARVKSLGTATPRSSTCATAQQLFDRGDQVDAILVGGARRRRPRRRAHGARRGAAAGRRSQTAAEQDRFTLDGLEQFIWIIRIALLVFGGVAVLVGAFTIFNTLSITVAQRTREFGLLRMVGAARRQVLGSVLVEALAIGAARVRRRDRRRPRRSRRRSTRCSTR